MIRALPYIFKTLLFSALLVASLSSRSQCPAFNATATPALQTVCSGTPITSIILNSLPGTHFNWTRDNATIVTGIPASGSGNISGTLTNTTNAPVVVSFTITPMVNQFLNESFNTVLPPGWAQQNLSSPIGTQPAWFAGTAMTPFTPPGYIAVNCNSTTGGNVSSNWLFTPQTSIRSGDILSFYLRASDSTGYLERIQVRLSTNGNSLNAGNSNTSVGDFSTMIFDIFTAGVAAYPTTWTKVDLAIPPGIPVGTTGRIAFRYFTTFAATHPSEVGIDNVVLAACPGQPITATVIVNPAATVNTVPNQNICNGAATSAVNFSSPATGGTTVYNWINSNTAIGLSASGTGSIPSFTATNAGNSPVSGTITVTPAFTNTTPTTISFLNPAAFFLQGSGVASPYPYSVSVSGLPNTGVSLLAVKLRGVNYPAAGDLDIVLQSPTGQNVILMSDAGGANALSNATLTLQDGAPLMSYTSSLTTGAYACTNYESPDNWPAPGPGVVAQSNPALGLLTPNFNGTWRLFIYGDSGNGTGIINGGCELIFGYGTPATCNGTPLTFSYTVNPQPTVSITSNIPPPILPGQVMTLTAVVSPSGGTFVWYKDGVVIPGATGNSLAGLTVNDLGNYTVTYTDPNGCVNTSAAFNVYARPSANLYVYPNPNTGQFNIRFYNEPNEEVTVTIYDHLGLKVFQKKYLAGSQRYSILGIQGQHFNTGNYFVEVVNSRGEKVGFKTISVLR